MNNMKKIFTLGLAGVGLLVAGMGSALAHTTSIGFEPGASAGEVTFWTGSYSHGGTPVNEGTLTLVGSDVVFGPTTVAFNLGPTNTKPAGLVDGTNNCYWTANAFSSLDCTQTTDTSVFGPVAWWQGVTFTGLAPGTYDFTCGSTCGTSAQWASLQGSGPNVFASLTLTAGDIGGGDQQVPEPGTLALMGIGLSGFGMSVMRRRRRKSA